MERPVFIAITGPTGAGKSYFTKHLIDYLEERSISCEKISTDEFYKDLSHIEFEERVKVNYDEPGSISSDEFLETITKLYENKSTDVPVYDFSTHTRFINKSRTIYPKQVVLVEGIFALSFKKISELVDIKIYIDLDPDLRLIRRVKRDNRERGRSVESVFKQYTSTVRPTQKRYVLDQKYEADMILHGNKNHEIIYKLIYNYLNSEVKSQ